MSRSQRNDKRDRLIQAADDLIYEKTFHTTTLADIAKAADVPLGNVYYYFKTKEAILEAVLQKRSKEWENLFTEWEQNPDSKERLQALVQYFANQSEKLRQFGCVIGSLCQELGKQSSALAASSAKLMQNILDWTEKQFQALGKAEQSPLLAQHLLASIQGMSLLTVTLKQENYLQKQNELLQDWLANV